MLHSTLLHRLSVEKSLSAMESFQWNSSSEGTNSVSYNILEEETDGEPESRPAPSVLSWAYYQRYFDVDTKHVTERIISSAIPQLSKDFLTHYIRPSPDLYGPLWLCISLSFTLAITGNVWDYFKSDNLGWRYNFNKVPAAGSITASYILFVPLVLLVFLWWQDEKHDVRFIELISLYGYSLAVYIPVSVLWTIPLPSLQWSVLVAASALSGSVMILSLWKALSPVRMVNKFLSVATVFILHFVFAVTLLLCFFHYPKNQ